MRGCFGVMSSSDTTTTEFGAAREFLRAYQRRTNVMLAVFSVAAIACVANGFTLRSDLVSVLVRVLGTIGTLLLWRLTAGERAWRVPRGIRASVSVAAVVLTIAQWASLLDQPDPFRLLNGLAGLMALGILLTAWVFPHQIANIASRR